MNVKLTGARITSFLMILLVFLDMGPYFVWSEVSSLGYTIYTGMILLTTLEMAFLFCTKRFTVGYKETLQEEKRIPLLLVAVSMSFVVLILYQMFLSGVVTRTAQPFNVAMIVIHVGLMLFSLQDHISLQKIYLYSKKIFAITLIPAIVIYLFVSVGISLPSVPLSSELREMATGYTYKLFMGVSVMMESSSGELPRLCGLFREPGFVGTLGALYLLGDRFALKKWENAVIFIACIFTFSVAFFLLLVLGLLLKKVVASNTKKGLVSGIVAVVLVVIGYFAFLAIPFPASSPFAQVQERLVITEDGLAGDNRMTEEYAVAAYENWAESGTKNVLFGYGEDNRKVPGTNRSIWMKAHSVKEYIFNFGVLSLVILCLSFISITLVKYRSVKGIRKRYIIVLLLIFMISIYQRYGVARFCYLCVLFGGASNLALTEERTEKTEKEKI